MIALNMDYDDLRRLSITSKQVYQVISNPIFWLNKIYHDFGVSVKLDIIEKLPNLYVKIATDHHYPVIGGEDYANSYRNLCRLIFNAARLGKSPARFIDKLKLFGFDADYINYNMLITIGTKMARGEKIISEIIAPAISGDIELIKKIPNDPTDSLRHAIFYELLKYAILFDHINIVEYIYPVFNDSEVIMEIAAYIGNNNSIQFAYDKAARDLDEAMLYAITYNNIEVMEKLISLGADIDIIEKAMNRPISLAKLLYLSGDRLSFDILIDYLDYAVHEDFYEAIEPLINAVGRSIDSGSLDVSSALLEATAAGIGDITHLFIPTLVRILVEAGANNINQALIDVINNHDIESVKILINAGATNLNEAYDKNNSEMIDMLINAGARYE